MLILKGMNSDGSLNSEPFEFELVDPVSGAPKGAYVSVLPLDSREVRKIQRSKRIRRPTPSRGIEETVDQEAVIAEVVQRCCVSWRGIGDRDGNPIVCSAETKAAIPEWIKLQVFMQAVGAGDDSPEVTEARFHEST